MKPKRIILVPVPGPKTPTPAELTFLAPVLKRQMLEQDMHEFVKEVWPVLEPERKFSDNCHISAIIKHLEAAARGNIRSLLINVPPASMKSLLVCVFWPAWVWTWRPQSRWLFASYSDALTVCDSMRCRSLIESEWYRSKWTNSTLAPDQNTKDKFANVKGGWRMATSVGGSSTGEHPDFVMEPPAKPVA